MIGAPTDRHNKMFKRSVKADISDGYKKGTVAVSYTHLDVYKRQVER